MGPLPRGFPGALALAQRPTNSTARPNQRGPRTGKGSELNALGKRSKADQEPLPPSPAECNPKHGAAGKSLGPRLGLFLYRCARLGAGAARYARAWEEGCAPRAGPGM